MFKGQRFEVGGKSVEEIREIVENALDYTTAFKNPSDYLEAVAQRWREVLSDIGGKLDFYTVTVEMTPYMRQHPKKYPFGGRIVADSGRYVVSLSYPGAPTGTPYGMGLDDYVDYVMADICAMANAPAKLLGEVYRQTRDDDNDD